eukprot:TRINITY_DN33905_c0_g1_i1.p1 TRINITY_DN33905_c0_g1~~TRINITY_DN33905_c0_g1_i1.p1  ORF type:complete len:418 (-),score=69.09 TRINITY_DN33905_c0_g1_i1:19-1272(-)
MQGTCSCLGANMCQPHGAGLQPAGGIFRNSLPPPAVPLSSAEGRMIFREALAEGTAEAFFPLVEQFQTQDEPTSSGLATLVMVLNALRVDPGMLWKGQWRWYDERSFGARTKEQEFLRDGVEWDEWLHIARCHGLLVEAVRAESEGASRAVFESCCASLCAEPAGGVLVVAFSREALGQTGDGHYSPVGAYHCTRSLALLLDTARFKYAPHWVPVADLWEAMRSADHATTRSRGYATFARGDASTPSACCSLKLTCQAWSDAVSWTTHKLPHLISSTGVATAEDELWTLVRELPPVVAALVNVIPCSAASQTASCHSSEVITGLCRSRAYECLKIMMKDHPDAILPASLETLTCLVLLLGRLGLLDDALPHAQQAGVWKVIIDNEDLACDRALDAEIRFLTRKSQDIISKQHSLTHV